MKAIQYTAFGNSTVLEMKELPKPAPKEDEVLIQVAATTVNPIDMKIRSGSMQKMMPVELPYTPGTDVSGIVEAVGSKVSRIKTGDRVFATTFGGTYAEYVTIKEDQVALVPENVTLNEAAALAVPIATSYTFLVAEGKLKAGEKVLILAASGGVGSIMVQMAKALGAYVVGTASGEGIKQVKNLGADEALDYKTGDLSSVGKTIDLVIDLAGGASQAKSFETLKTGGRLLSAVMPPSAELAAQYQVSAKFISSAPSHIKLEFGKKLVEEGKIKSEIAKTLKLKDAAQAQDLVTAGGLNGKIVLEIKS